MNAHKFRSLFYILLNGHGMGDRSIDELGNWVGEDRNAAWEETRQKLLGFELNSKMRMLGSSVADEWIEGNKYQVKSARGKSQERGGRAIEKRKRKQLIRGGERESITKSYSQQSDQQNHQQNKTHKSINAEPNKQKKITKKNENNKQKLIDLTPADFGFDDLADADVARIHPDTTITL